MKNFKSILFDIDDTLIDFKASEKISLKRCYDRYFKPHTALEPFLIEFHKTNQDLWRQVEEEKIPSSVLGYAIFRHLSNVFGRNFDFEISGFYEAELIENSTWINGAVDLLEELKKRQYKIGLISNGFAHIQRSKYKTLGLSKYTNVLVIAEEIGRPKPHPQIFYNALKFMGAGASETLMVGDSLSSDGVGAKKVGLKFCWYNPHKAANTLTWDPDYIIHDLKHLILE